MITHELLRELLKDDLRSIHEMAKFIPNEIVYKALVIREFMDERSIADARVGMREFYAYERDRLNRLGFLSSTNHREKEQTPKAVCVAAA